MSLRSKIVVILLGVVVLYTAVDNGLQRVATSRVFESWELDEGEKRTEEVAARIDSKIEELEGKASIWTNLPEVRDFVSGRSDAFSGAGQVDVLASSAVDLFYVCDATGDVLWSRVVDPSTGEAIHLSHELPAGSLHPSHTLLTFRADQRTVSGLMMTERWPLLVSSTPIPGEDGRLLREDADGFLRPVQGVVILGRFIGPEMRRSIGTAASAAIDVFTREDRELSARESELVDLLTAGELETASMVGDDGALHLFRVFEDLRTRYPLLLRVSLDREITARGERAVRLALLSTLATALLILFVMLRLLQRIVVRPLSSLTTKAVEIGRTDNTTIRTGLVRDDEIGQLSSEFDGMLDKLAQSRAEVVKTARMAGMSEIATGVLHNVGNVLNSVNVSASCVKRRAEELDTEDLEKIAEVMSEHQGDLGHFVAEDPRGAHLVPFFLEVTEGLVGQRREILQELGTLGAGIDHIADLVRAQQRYSGTKGVFEYASIADEVDAALRMCTGAMDWPSKLEVEREYEELPSFKVDRHKLMEVLVNLIQNARQAVEESGRDDMRVTLRVKRRGKTHARIEVADNGIGIAPENRERIFHHGFTTKDGGHGFGLHLSANAATEMQGSLGAESEGPGRGATFFLDLPMENEELVAAA